MIRAKGHFWIATRPEWAAEFSLAGSMSSVTPLGFWWAALPETRRPTDAEAQAEISRHWCAPWGDRRQQIVFIGAGIDRQALTAALDAALMPVSDFAPEAWADLPDPFPKWGRKAA